MASREMSDHAIAPWPPTGMAESLITGRHYVIEDRTGNAAEDASEEDVAPDTVQCPPTLRSAA